MPSNRFDPLFNPKTVQQTNRPDSSYPTLQTTPRSNNQSPISGKLMDEVFCKPFGDNRTIPVMIDAENRLCFPIKD